ncbi:MAG TPA: alkaline phosphatase D family protein [Sphingobacteriaceae bacterium]
MKTYTLLFLFFIQLPLISNAQNEFRIAFGSCNRQNRPQPLWDNILNDQPDLWIWLGDNIYGDSHDMTVLKNKYELQRSNPDYQKIMSNVPIVGIWDDHDYGKNDGGKDFSQKRRSQKLLLDFLGEPMGTARRKRAGIYTAYQYKAGDKTIKLILLDGRFHRDKVRKKNGTYVPNPKGDILGEQQWKWLEAQLKNSTADVHIIASGIQVIAEDHGYEKWANFPRSRQRLFNLLTRTKPKGVIFLSGDRHIGDFSKVSLPGLDYPVYDITSSGLTHSSTNISSEPNRHRSGLFVNQKHYGLLTLKDEGEKTSVEVSLKGDEETFHTERYRF